MRRPLSDGRADENTETHVIHFGLSLVENLTGAISGTAVQVAKPGIYTNNLVHGSVSELLSYRAIEPLSRESK
jgi:hypothetical protein